jgi:hypothetical protein
MPRLTEADYKLPTTGDRWYDGTDHPVDVRLSTGHYVTNAGSSMKSLMADTAMVNGKLPPSQEQFNNFMAQWLPPIRSTLQGTEGGGYMYGGMQPGFWNDGAHGVITVEPGARTQFVHVVTRPTNDMVRQRDNGSCGASGTASVAGVVAAFAHCWVRARGVPTAASAKVPRTARRRGPRGTGTVDTVVSFLAAGDAAKRQMMSRPSSADARCECGADPLARHVREDMTPSETDGRQCFHPMTTVLVVGGIRRTWR